MQVSSIMDFFKLLVHEILESEISWARNNPLDFNGSRDPGT